MYVCVSVCVCDGPTRDVIGVAKTGSGKTLAFLLPMFRHIQVHTYVLTCRERFFRLSIPNGLLSCSDIYLPMMTMSMTMLVL